MAGRTGPMVECPICGEQFDPTAAGGWCTNSACGEWQYESEDRQDVEETTERPPAEATDEDPDAGDGTGRTFPEGWAQTDNGSGAAGSDSEVTPPEPPSDLFEMSAEVFDSEEESADTEAHDQGETIEEAGTESGDGETVRGQDTDVDEKPVPDEECPSCGGEVGPGDNYCVSCGEDLTAHQDTDRLTACPSCGEDVGPGENFCASCGEDLAAHRGEKGDGETAPQTLLLATRGEEIAVTDGDTVGRELRRIIIASGGDEDQAVRIHREHVRFVREDGQFYMVDLGKNPTRLNGNPLEKGDRRPVSPGDEIELSGVLGLVIRES